MDVDRPLVDIDVVSPDAVEQLLAREHAPGRLHEELQQAEFGGPEMDLASAPAHAARLAVELDVSRREHGGHRLRLRPPQDRLSRRARDRG